MAKWGGRKTDEDWKVMVVREKDVRKSYHKREGRIMFPTSHDLVPSDPSLDAGNEVLVTTKPHLEAIKYMCETFEPQKAQVQFRFTITSASDKLLKFWEPGAPAFAERVASLEYAALSGYKTSVSIEPILDRTVAAIDDLYSRVESWCTESVWLGIMNHVKDGNKVDPGEVYRHFVNRDKTVRFKDSIRNAVGIV
jgi:DNA repair photolyase